MSFVRAEEYSREAIATVLGVSARESVYAVILKQGVACALVVAANGQHPSGKRYKNTLGPEVFVMHGENDERGRRSQTAPVLQLFFSHASNGSYAYEGHVRFTRVTVLGDPFREFARLSYSSSP